MPRGKGYDAGHQAELEVLRWARMNGHPAAQLVDPDDPGLRWTCDIHDPQDRHYTVEVKHDQQVDRTGTVCLELLLPAGRPGPLLWSKATWLAYKLADMEGFYWCRRLLLVHAVLKGEVPARRYVEPGDRSLLALVARHVFTQLPYLTLLNSGAAAGSR